MSRRRRRDEDPEAELTTVARDPGAGGRWARLAPLALAAALSVPLLWISILFSLEVAEIASLLIQLGADLGTQVGVVLMTLGGFVCLVGVLVCLFVGWRRDTWAWRWSWAGVTVLVAGLMPLLGLVFGAYWQ